MPKLASVIEAILYLKGRPLSIARIAEHAGCDREMAEEGLMELMNDYAHRESALEIIETKEGYCLQLKSGFRHLVDTLIPLDLGVGALRTLAAIALRGPIAQTDLIDLRGSGAYQHVHELVSLGFVRKRRQSDGRSFWLQVTDKFHQHFEIDDLPTFNQKTGAAKVAAADAEVDEGNISELSATAPTEPVTSQDVMP
jgi:segregation and condensation protein B